MKRPGNGLCAFCKPYEYNGDLYNHKHCPMNCKYARDIKKEERQKFIEHLRLSLRLYI